MKCTGRGRREPPCCAHWTGMTGKQGWVWTCTGIISNCGSRGRDGPGIDQEKRKERYCSISRLLLWPKAASANRSCPGKSDYVIARDPIVVSPFCSLNVALLQSVVNCNRTLVAMSVWHSPEACCRIVACAGIPPVLVVGSAGGSEVETPATSVVVQVDPDRLRASDLALAFVESWRLSFDNPQCLPSIATTFIQHLCRLHPTPATASTLALRLSS